MNEILRKNDVIRFMTRDPQVHLIEMFGHCEFNPEEIGREEYVGRIKSVIGDGESFLMSTLSPMPGFLCIADAVAARKARREARRHGRTGRRA